MEIVAANDSTIGSWVPCPGKLPSNRTTARPPCPFRSLKFCQQPYLAVGPEDISLTMAGVSVDVESLEVTGTLAPDGTTFGGGTFSGTHGHPAPWPTHRVLRPGCDLHLGRDGGRLLRQLRRWPALLPRGRGSSTWQGCQQMTAWSK